MVGVLMVAGCNNHAAATRPCAAATPRGATGTELRAEFEKAKKSVYYEVRAGLSSDPVAVLSALQVPEGDFMAIANALSQHWARNNPPLRAPEAPRQPTPRPTSPPVEVFAFWCTGLRSEAADSCFRDKNSCEGLAREMNSQFGGSMRPCEGRHVAACFTSKNRLHNHDTSHCYSSFERCEEGVREMKAHPADWTVTSSCTRAE